MPPPDNDATEPAGERIAIEAKRAYDERKFDKAAKLLFQADANDPEILYDIGSMYYFGHGLKRDRKKAFDFMSRAKALGAKGSDKMLAWMRFDRTEKLVSHTLGLAAALFCAWFSPAHSPYPFYISIPASFALAWFFVFNTVSLAAALSGRRIGYFFERLGMFLGTVIGALFGGFVVELLFIGLSIVVHFAKYQLENLMPCLIMLTVAGALAGAWAGHSFGEAVGSSTAQSFGLIE